MQEITCRPVANDREKELALSIRKQVFVKEQKLFNDTDEDQFDDNAIHLVAEMDGEIVGTVRLYNEKEDIWIGGRLAVLTQHRGRVGSRLVKRAVIEAEQQGARLFKAQVQSQNERFFQRLGWKTVGEKQIICGYEHMDMIGPLKNNKQGADNIIKKAAS